MFYHQLHAWKVSLILTLSYVRAMPYHEIPSETNQLKLEFENIEGKFCTLVIPSLEIKWIRVG